MRIVMMMMLCCCAIGYSQESTPEENPPVATGDTGEGSDHSSFIDWACDCGKKKGGKPK